MRRSRRQTKSVANSEAHNSSDSDEQPLVKKTKKKVAPQKIDADSSSESDIENYLQPIDKIDLRSSFFDTETKNNNASLHKINDVDKNVGPIKDETCNKYEEASTSHFNFQQLHEFTKKMEQAKIEFEQYESKKRNEENRLNISKLLEAGESSLVFQKENCTEMSDLAGSLHSSDFESCSDSDKEWEEVKESQKNKDVVPKKNIQITVEMPNVLKKKKGVDLIAAMKRRFNRIKKENQVSIHKVHLLCWIAHGNYVSSSINSEKVLALGLSLLPSKHCYPADRTDLNYLEQIVKWFKNTFNNVEKVVPKSLSLENLLQLQMQKKEVYNNKMLVYVFIAVLRSLGIQCRLVLNFQVEPVRPPSSQLCSLSTKTEEKVEEGVKSKKVALKTTPKKGVSTSKSQIQTALNPSTVVEGTAKKTRTKATGTKGERTIETESLSNRAKAKSQSVIKSKAVTVENNNTSNSQPKESKIEQTRKTRSKSTKAEETNKTEFLCGKTKTRSKSTTESKEVGIRNTKTIKSQTRDKVEETAKKTRLKIDEEPEMLGKRAKTRSQSLTESNAVTIKNTKSLNNQAKEDSKEAKTKLEVNKSDNKIVKKTADRKQSKQKNKNTKDIIKIKLPTTKSNHTKLPQLDGVFDSTSEESDEESNTEVPTTSKVNLKSLGKKESRQCSVRKHPPRLKGPIKYKDTDSEDDFETANIESPIPKKANLKKLTKAKSISPEKGSRFFKNSQSGDVRQDIVQLVKGRIKEQKDIERSKTARKSMKPESEEDSDFMPEEVRKKPTKGDLPKIKKRLSRKAISSSDEETKMKKGINVWAEVFLENEEKWISVDVIKGQVHCVSEIYVSWLGNLNCTRVLLVAYVH